MPAPVVIVPPKLPAGPVGVSPPALLVELAALVAAAGASYPLVGSKGAAWPPDIVVGSGGGVAKGAAVAEDKTRQKADQPITAS